MNKLLVLLIFNFITLTFLSCSSDSQNETDISQPDSVEVIEDDWKKNFDIHPEDMSTTGRNEYFILERGYYLELENEDEKVIITVLDSVVEVHGFETRVVEEREFESGELKEISWNYFAISVTTGDVYYFGEDVDIYKNGEVVSHQGAWKSGVDGAQFGMIMPSEPTVGQKYYQEYAPEVAMDRAEHVNLNKIMDTPAGEFEDCLEVRETSAIDSNDLSIKVYAPGVGLVFDDSLILTEYGYREYY